MSGVERHVDDDSAVLGSHWAVTGSGLRCLHLTQGPGKGVGWGEELKGRHVTFKGRWRGGVGLGQVNTPGFAEGCNVGCRRRWPPASGPVGLVSGGAPGCSGEDGWAGRVLLNKEVFSDHVAPQACARQPGGDVQEMCPDGIRGPWPCEITIPDFTLRRGGSEEDGGEVWQEQPDGGCQGKCQSGQEHG